MTQIIKALEYASSKHKGQLRKYSGEAYIIHPMVVSQICARFTDDEDTIVSAILHDVVEDSDATLQDIHDLFGKAVAENVKYCSEISQKWDGGRESRKKADREHYAKGTFASKMIKIADAIHNCSNMGNSHSTFTQLYFSEKVLMVNEIIESLAPIIMHDNVSKVKHIADVFNDMIDNWTKVGIFIETIDRSE